jgi:hypothetical protein
MHEEPFPTDWREWHTLWQQWESSQNILRPTSYKFPGGKNFLADEVLGVWALKLPDGTARNVELSEVTFPNLSERDEAGRLIRKTVRGVGITYADASGRYVPSDLGPERNNVVNTFADLEAELRTP